MGSLSDFIVYFTEEPSLLAPRDAKPVVSIPIFKIE
jgi:hypothetical protein